MGLFFAPVANVVLSSVGWQEQGQASGANNALPGSAASSSIAVLAAIFANRGGYAIPPFGPQHFIDGLKPAMWVGATVVGIGAIICLLHPAYGEDSPSPRRRATGRRAATQVVGTGDWTVHAGADAGVVGGRPGGLRRNRGRRRPRPRRLPEVPIASVREPGSRRGRRRRTRLVRSGWASGRSSAGGHSACHLRKTSPSTPPCARRSRSRAASRG